LGALPVAPLRSGAPPTGRLSGSGICTAANRRCSLAKYGKKAQQKVSRAMRERKKGKLKSGRSGKKVTSRKQAIAIGLSEARRSGGKVPKKKGGSSKKK
jgi:hypothetical protein